MLILLGNLTQTLITPRLLSPNFINTTRTSRAPTLSSSHPMKCATTLTRSNNRMESLSVGTHIDLIEVVLRSRTIIPYSSRWQNEKIINL